MDRTWLVNAYAYVPERRWALYALPLSACEAFSEATAVSQKTLWGHCHHTFHLASWVLPVSIHQESGYNQLTVPNSTSIIFRPAHPRKNTAYFKSLVHLSTVHGEKGNVQGSRASRVQLTPVNHSISLSDNSSQHSPILKCGIPTTYEGLQVWIC